VTTDRNCLDAETVAAWMDGGLDAAGVAAAEAHASTCERCQALLATVVKTLPIETPLAPGHEARGTARFWKWWLAPLAATAAAVTIWMVVPQTPMQTPMQPPAASAPARDMAAESFAKPQAPAEPAAPRDSLAGARRNVPASPANEEGKAKLADTATATADGSGLERRDASASAREPSSELLRDKQGKREENARAAEMRQAAAPPPAAPSPAAGAERMREVPTASNPAVGAITQLRKQVAAPEIVSPDPQSRWRATTPGTIERSEDAGRIWIAVRIAPNEEVLAGASPGPLACWFVGRSGLVLLATDGTNFTRLPFPESVDLVAVSSPEPRIATVTTADGRTFRTEDAGRNWRNP
jgi:hypothetical protein